MLLSGLPGSILGPHQKQVKQAVRCQSSMCNGSQRTHYNSLCTIWPHHVWSCTPLTTLASFQFLPHAKLFPASQLCPHSSSTWNPLSLQLFHRHPNLIFQFSTKMSPLQKGLPDDLFCSCHPKPESYSSSLYLVSFTEFVIIQLADS